MNSPKLKPLSQWSRLPLGLSLGVLFICALGMTAWITIPPIPKYWPTNPVAWWTPERFWNRPLTSMRPTFQGIADVREVDGRSAFVVGPEGRVNLGRWSAKEHATTMAFWARLTIDPKVNTKSTDIVLTESSEPNIRFQVLIKDEHFEILWTVGSTIHRFHADGSGGVLSAGRIPRSQWVHIAVSVEGFAARFYVNGKPAGEVPLSDLAIVQNPRLALGPGPVEGISIQYDDVVLFDRVLSDFEFGALASVPRGGLAGRYDRTATEARLRQWSFPGRAGFVVFLGALGAILVLARAIGVRWNGYKEPEERIAIGVFSVLMGLTLVGSFWLGREARNLDRLEFEREADQFTAHLEADLQRLGDLTNLARDWALLKPGSTNLTQVEWDVWAANHRAEHDFPGFLGIGLAQAVLPKWGRAMEAEWSTRHGFPFRIWHDPSIEPVFRPLRLLEPFSAPVVVYHPWHLAPQKWLSNQTILGKDLLAMSEKTAKHEILPEPDRIAEAIGNGNLTSSGIIEIAPESWYGQSIRGIRIYSAAVRRPTPDGEKVTASILSGSVAFTSVDLGRWIHDELHKAPPKIACQLWDGATHEDRYHLGFDSGELEPGAEFRTAARFHCTREVKAFYFRLWIDFASTEGFEASARENWQWHFGGIAFAFSTLTSTVFLMQGRRRNDLKRQAHQLTQANMELLKAQKERDRLSRNLHDGTIQNLYAVGLHLQYARRSVGSDDSPAMHGIGEAQHLVQETIVELREFLLALKDEAIRGRPFRLVFGEIFDRLRGTTSAELRLDVAEQSDWMPSWIVVQVVQIAREALSNALRHSNANRIEIRLNPMTGAASSPDGVGWRLEIEDNGSGIPKNGPGPSRGGGLGLMTMRERAAELGGHLTVESTDGTGTCIRLDFILDPNETSSTKR